MVRARLKILIALVCLPFLVILGRLGSLQLVAEVRDDYLLRAEHRSRQFSSPARGRIFARDGKTLLATNQPVCQLQFRYSVLDPREKQGSLNPREEPLWVLLDELGKKPGAPKRDEIERRIIELARPEALAAGPDPGDEDEADDPAVAARAGWMLLLENVDGASAAVLSRRWKRCADVFEVRPSSNGASSEVWFRPARAARMEITLARIQNLLRGAGATSPDVAGVVSSSDLSKRVGDVLTRIEERVEREVKKDRDEGVGSERVQRKARDVRRYYYGQSWLLAGEVPRSVVTEIEYRPWRYPGISCVDSVRRVYPLKEACGTITGYLRRLDSNEEAERKLKEDGKLLDAPSSCETLEKFAVARVGGAMRTDWIGASGLEEMYDAELRGLHGMSVFHCDRQGRPVKVLEGLSTEDGKDIRASIDPELQKLLYAALERAVKPLGGSRAGSAGSAAVMDLKSGELLASVGFPGVDPGRIREEKYLDELEDRWGDQTRRTWFIDRPSSLPLFPGSVFKIVVAVAAMEQARPWEGDFSPDRRYPCHHKFDLIPSLACDSVNGHTSTEDVSLAEALQFSCNNYFYWVALKHLGADPIAAWAYNLGYGRPSGIDLPPLSPPKYQAGVLRAPDSASRPGQVCHYAIGQEMVEATPLQVLRSYAAIALGGKSVPKPFLVRPSPPDRLVLENPRTIDVIREGLWRVGHAQGGTASRPEHRLFRFNAAYKTGTAEVKRGDVTLNHGWLVGFAPFEKPRIAFVAVVEESPIHGADSAGPIVETLLTHFAQGDPAAYLLERKSEPKGAGR